MSARYVTSGDHLPDDPTGEVTIQITDRETKEIFRTRARLARDPDDLDDPDPLTVLRGPHENTEEQWYVEVVGTELDAAPIDETVLDECIERSRTESDVVTVRSEDVRALVTYLVETGEYDSVSGAVRSLVRDRLSETRPALVERYVDRRASVTRDALARELGSGDGGDGE